MQTRSRLGAAILLAGLSGALLGCGPTTPAPATEANAQASRDEAPATGEAPAIATERYYGLFGDAANPSERMGTYFVSAARPPAFADHFPDLPPGTIMIGAVWADVAPWYLLPVSETRFEQTLTNDFAPPVAAVFELDGEGNAVALTIEGLPNDPYGRRSRISDLPPEYR